MGQVEKRCDLGRRDVQDSGRALHQIPRNRGKEPIILDEDDTPVDGELSLSSSPHLGLSPTKNRRAKSSKRTSYRPAFSDVVSGMFRRAKREAGKGQNQPD